MQKTVMAAAVASACAQIGYEHRERVRRAAFEEMSAAAKAVTIANARLKVEELEKSAGKPAVADFDPLPPEEQRQTRGIAT